jgi:plastocyanin
LEVIAMRRQLARSLTLFGTVSLAISWLIAAPTASAGDPCYHSFEMPAATSEATTQVKLMPCAFGPTVAQVPVGSTVTFFNGPDFTHLVTGANQAWGSRDAEIQPGGTVSYTFDTAGVYPYACALHRGMSGAIVVGDVAAATGGAGAAGAGTTGAGVDAPGTAATSATTTATGSVDGPMLLTVALGIAVILGVLIVVVAVRRRHAHDEPASPQAA